jgi:hypothetical protein
MGIKPIKRNKHLKWLSRDHHFGLLACWKIRQGLKIKLIQPASYPTKSPVNVIRVLVEKKSNLKINGNSNESSFSCNIHVTAINNTVLCVNDLSRHILLPIHLEMYVISFNCHSDLITKDLRKH